MLSITSQYIPWTPIHSLDPNSLYLKRRKMKNPPDHPLDPAKENEGPEVEEKKTSKAVVAEGRSQAIERGQEVKREGVGSLEVDRKREKRGVDRETGRESQGVDPKTGKKETDVEDLAQDQENPGDEEGMREKEAGRGRR